MKLFAKSIYYSIFKPTKIYEFRNHSIKRVVLYYIFVTLLLTFPINLGIVNMKNFMFDNFQINIVKEEVVDYSDEVLLEKKENDYFDFIESIPMSESCIGIQGHKLNCTTSKEIKLVRTQKIKEEYLTERVTIVFNPSNDYVLEDKNVTTILLHETYFDLYLSGNKFKLDYSGFDGNLYFYQFNAEGVTDADALKTFLNGIALSMKDDFAFLASVVIVLIFGIMNFLFIVIVAFLARFLRFRDTNFPEYGEVLKMLIYCSTIPCLIGMLLGGLNLYAFATVLYNLLVPAVGAAVYITNKAIIKGLNTTKQDIDSQFLL